jgi:hypothetical protein
MADVQVGKGIVYGITNNGTPITMTGVATFLLSAVKAQHQFDISEVKDGTDFDAVAIGTNMHVEVDVDWVPSGATRADAAATADFPVALSKITLANFAIARFNGDYQYRGGSIDLQNKEGKMTFKLRKYDDATQNTSLTTPVTG